MESRPAIVFFSKSNEIFEIIPEECYSRWRFHLISSDNPSAALNAIENISLLIVDTYSLTIRFLEKLMSTEMGANTPILVLDNYEEEILIDELLNRGVKGYLLVHAFGAELERTIGYLLEGKHYRTKMLEQKNY